ncbi:adenylyltransferase/sulfurtransferase [Paenibacillus phyllosphaerae]|uniref:Adenylyltransferase/sulfurtransferase n=1 Tax=Paenibacillus phyllosphaerae TaxID=274593 RepID=A0A7W5AT45_9BACL|nr:ThiF family adenylyltransferase [Paenibacillus phyllosphaerae]MBB3108305.1 adenylyltransferase/sulfurtransferase [Paenibacillus phyllosphaerae]
MTTYESSQDNLNASAVSRYARQIRYAPIGPSGQERLTGSRVAVVGLGALGSVAAQHLVRSGVGFVRIIDRDVLEWSNLQRQVLYTEDDVLRMLPKAEAAASRLQSMNSTVTIEPHVTDVTSSNAEELLSEVDLIVDGSDNFTVRYLINDVSLKHGIPWIYGGVVGSTGMTMNYIPGKTPCFRCLFPNPPQSGAVDTCDTAGVISPAVDVVASLQSAEALKWLSGNAQAMRDTLLQLDLWHQQWMPLKVGNSHRDDCPACAKGHYEFLEQHTFEPAAVALCGRMTVQVTPGQPASLSFDELEQRLGRIGEVERNPFLLKYRRDADITMVIFLNGRALIQGTEDPILAKRVYAELFSL